MLMLRKYFELRVFSFFTVSVSLLCKMTTPGFDHSMFVCFSVSFASDAIFGAVKLKYLMASYVSFVFSFAKATLSIKKQRHLWCMFAAVFSSGRGVVVLTLV